MPEVTLPLSGTQYLNSGLCFIVDTYVLLIICQALFCVFSLLTLLILITALRRRYYQQLYHSDEAITEVR